MSKFIVASLGLAGVLSVGAVPASATTYDLKSDWSNTDNSNGVWTYLAGTTVLPSLNGANWGGYGFGPGFAASSSFGPGFAPVIFQYNDSNPSAVAASMGDIVAHTQTKDVNFGAGNFSVEFTAPTAGTATITGDLWNAHVGFFRWQDWTVTVGGAQMASGLLKDWTVNGPADPETFDLSGVTLTAGEIVQLTIVYDPNAQQVNGTLVGLDINVALTPTTVVPPTVPEPASWSLLLAGVAGLGVLGSIMGRKAGARAA